MIAGFLSFGRKSLLAHPLAETFLHLKWLVRPYLKDAEQNLVNLSHFPVRLEDSDDEHAALCSLPHLLHWAGSLDNNRQAPPHRWLVRKDQGGAVGGVDEFLLRALRHVRQMVKLKKILYSVLTLDIANIIPKLVLRPAAPRHILIY